MMRKRQFKLEQVGLILLMVGILSFGVLAGSKPVAGTITYIHGTASLPVVLHVSVNASGSLQECVINPIVNTGLGGSFATNLDNLVLRDTPTVRCNGLWSMGDMMWYTFEYEGKEFLSPVEKIKSGTGLQVLGSVVLDLGGSSIDSSVAGGGGGGARSSVGSDASDSRNIPKEVGVEVPPKIELLLQSSPVDMNLDVTVFGRVISGDVQGGLLRVEVLKLPEGTVVDFREVDIVWPFTQDVNFDMKTYKSGRYKVQAIVLDGGSIVGASAPDIFTLRISDQEISGTQNFAGMAFAWSGRARSFFDSPYVGLVAYFISFVLVLTAVLLFAYKRRHYAHQIPVEEAERGEGSQLVSINTSKEKGFKR